VLDFNYVIANEEYQQPLWDADIPSNQKNLQDGSNVFQTKNDTIRDVMLFLCFYVLN